MRRPNTILGLIPLGYADNAYPLTNTASVGVSAKFSVGRLVFGLLFVVTSIATFAYVFIDWGQGAYVIREVARRPGQEGLSREPWCGVARNTTRRTQGRRWK